MSQSVSQTVNTSHLCGCKYSTSGVVTRRIHASLKTHFKVEVTSLSHTFPASCQLYSNVNPPPKLLGTFIESFLLHINKECDCIALFLCQAALQYL